MNVIPTILAPSILAGKHTNLAASADQIEASGAEWMHLDIMDGHFVPNLTFGPQTVKELREQSRLYLDTHLMLDNPDEYIEAFAKAGADNITIHTEPNYPITETLKAIKSLDCDCGISINPDTPVEDLLPYLELVNLVLLMAVQPGHGGQTFKDSVIPKIKQVHSWRTEKNLNFRIEVDGGIDETTGAQCLEAGADTLVAGTAFFKAPDQKAFISSFV